MSASAAFAAVAVTIYAAHQAGDYWVQTSTQATRKGLPGWDGRRACAAHVATYTITLAAFLALAWWWLTLPLVLPWTAAGLAVSAVTHYFADRRVPLRRVADLTAHGSFFRAGDGLATGAALLDQAWHWVWLFASALIISGAPQ
jgi:anti-sigma factor RsiW